MPLKQLIQPFFSPLYQDRVIASNTKQPAATSRLRWGTAGALPTAQQQNPATGVNFKIVSNKTFTQWGKPTTETVTVTGSDGVSSVDVQRIKSIQFTAPDQIVPATAQTATAVPSPAPSAAPANPTTQNVYSSLTPQQPGNDIETFDLSFADDGLS